MPVWAGLAIASVFVAAFERWRRTEPDGISAEAVVLVGAGGLVLIGILATLLATFDRFGASTMTVGCAVLAGALWPWTRKPAPRRTPNRHWAAALLPLLLVGSGVALRLPLNDYGLAGRDQGTYALRARQTLRTGSFEVHDPVLANAGTEVLAAPPRQRSGPHDILGLYPERDAAWRAGLYEAAYRPGWYLTDRDRGRVVPQFFHLHPMLLATTGLVLGPERLTWLLPIQAALAMAAIWCVARRLWPHGAWPVLPAGLYATAPLVVWVHRTALTEVMAGLLVAASVLALLRARSGGKHHLVIAAMLLGSIAWLRGNAWLSAPVVLAMLWLVPGEAPHRRAAVSTYLAALLSGVLVHVSTVFPYVYDELRRQIGVLGHPTPIRLALGAAVLALAWTSVDALAFGRHGTARHAPQLIWLRRNGPRVLAVGLGVAIAGYVLTRLGAPPKPHSRLDAAIPMIGIPILGVSAIGLVATVHRWRPARGVDMWLLALAASTTVTVALYAQRNLPHLSLYYYGRYLVPEIVPAVFLLATAALHEAHAFARARLSPRAVLVSTTVAAAGLAWSVAGIFVTHPVARLREFAGAERMVDWIAARVPEDAVIIAGGEGWHHGHTFNQVGGALAMGHGRVVIPYRTREAAWATAWELLVARPQATGEPRPPVYLLVNEATHPLERGDGVRAAVDDVLPAPFLARRIDLLELVVHRLTPVTDAVPTRVTRDELRMALFALDMESMDTAGVHRWSFEQWAPGDVPTGPPGLSVDAPDGPHTRGICLDDERDVELHLPDLASGPHSVVLVATPGTAVFNHRWHIDVDGETRDTTMPAAHRRARDTLGPFVVDHAPRSIRIRGSPRTSRRAPCPHGGLLELRILPPDRSWLHRAPVHATTFGPPKDLGHPVHATAWVSGRGLSRYRAGLPAPVRVDAVSLVLTPELPLRFAPAPLPADGDAPLDLVVTLTATDVDPTARLVLLADGQELATLDPPDQRSGTWQSKPIRFQPEHPVATFELRLRPSAQASTVHVRDIGLFSRTPPVRGELL